MTSAYHDKAGLRAWVYATASWAALLLALVVGAAAVCGGTGCGATLWDQVLLAVAHRSRTPELDVLFSTITWAGSLKLLAPIAAALVLMLSVRRRLREALFLALALAGASAISHLAKLWILRPRPNLFEAVTAMPADLSFPSAHSAQAIAFAIAICCIASRSGAAWPTWLCSMFAVVVSLVAVSRIYLQVHYPTDVLAGLVIGALWVVGLRAVMLPSGKHSGTSSQTF